MTTKMALYDEDYNGIVVETTDGHRFGWQVIKDEDGTVHLPRFTEENGTRFFYEQEAADCEPFDEDGIFDSREDLYDAVENAAQKYMTVTEDGTVLQGFVIAVYGPFFPDEQAYEDGQDIAPVLNSKAQTFPVSRFVDNGKFHKMTAKEIFNEL